MIGSVYHKEINQDNGDSEGFPYTEDEECELGEFFEGCEKYRDDIHGYISMWEK